MEKLSEHFTLEEATFSSTAIRKGIPNTPSDRVLSNIRKTAGHMEVVRDILDRLPIHIHSWYRCSALNVVVGGSDFSDHIDGWAVDWTCPRMGPPKDICVILQEELGSWDQIIMEGGWVHTSFSPKLRKEILTAHFSPGGVAYSKGLV